LVSVTHEIPTPQHHRWVVPLALVSAAAMLAAWFPLSALWHQQSQIDATQRQIAVVQRQTQALERQAHAITSPTAATRLARQEYQLVRPGQSLIQVLPGRQAPGSASGDPGNAPLVAPATAVAPGTAPSPATHHASGLHAFLSRLVRTLEFWR
jgi:hypothetical protein